jgi:RNA polymerase sigma-70 factor, ECF subfamily
MSIANTLERVSDQPAISADIPSDIALVSLIAGGDKPAIRMLFVRHRIQVYRFALRLTGDPGTAEDIVSDVFLEAWRSAGSFQGRSKVSTWLLAITRHLVWSTLRRHSAVALDEARMDEVEDRSDTPEVAVQKRQQSAVVAYCLQKLSPAHREVIDLVYYHEMSISEVADIIGIPESTVKTRMFYARKELADILREFEITGAAKRSRRSSEGRRRLILPNQSDLVH